RDKNLYTEGNGIPDHGEPHVDEDFSAISSSDIYCSYTDTFRTPSYSEHFPQGIKIWQKSYAWNMGSANDAIIMFDYTIVNVGKHTLNDVYVGMFADMDVGPISVSDIAQHNYAGYDSATRTAYIHNPVDIGSTPLGMTLLALSRPLDSVTQIFQWHDFDPPCGDANDSALYSCLSCEAFGNTECIKPDQSSVDLNDTRVVMANGPFGPVVPGDTLKMSYAFISGDNIIDMLNNAIKAHQLKNSIFPNGINKQNEMPLVHKLNQNYPNPFNPSTVIRYQLSANSYVTLKVYDVLGREVASLVNGMQDAGFKIQEWNATGQASGIYFYRLTAGDFVEVKKMLLIR
ncbi:MAG: T9SS type A sorting domain-containing protein, partial [Bacteroidetes bacterium]